MLSQWGGRRTITPDGAVSTSTRIASRAWRHNRGVPDTPKSNRTQHWRHRAIGHGWGAFSIETGHKKWALSGVLLTERTELSSIDVVLFTLGSEWRGKGGFWWEDVMFLSVRNDCKCIGRQWKLSASGWIYWARHLLCVGVTKILRGPHWFKFLLEDWSH